MIRHFELAVILSSLGLLLALPHASADAPRYIPIQGYLADAEGKPVDRALDMRIRLYESATASSALFDENLSAISVEDGYFTVYLGSQKVLDLTLFAEHPIVFVGILIAGDTQELAPRRQLATAPYAAFSQHCGDASTLGGLTVEELSALASGPGGPFNTGALSCPPGTCIRDISGKGVVSCEAHDAVASSTIEAYCYNTESELLAVLDDHYIAKKGGVMTGTLTAPNYALANKRTEYVTIPGVVFADQGKGGLITAHDLTGRYLFNAGAAAGAYVHALAAVSLPHGAAITEVSCSFVRASAGELADVALFRSHGDGTAIRLSYSAFPENSTATGNSARLTATGLNEGVILPSRFYYLSVGMTNSASGSSFSRLALNGCYVAYTRAEL